MGGALFPEEYAHSSSSLPPLVRLEYDDEANIRPNVFKHRTPKQVMFLSIVGGRSHVKPLLEIGQILVDRVSPNANKIIAREHPKIELITIDPIWDETTTIAQNLFLDEYVNFRHWRALFRKTENHYPYAFPILLNATIERQADLLICEMEWMAEICADVAWVLGLPIVLEHYELGAAVNAPYKSDPLYTTNHISGCHVSLENLSFWDRFKCVAILHPLLKLVQYESMFYFNSHRSVHGIEWVWSPMERIKDSLYLANTFFGFEVPEKLSPLVQEIGPIYSEYYEPLTKELKEFLDSHPRTMYIAFGDRFWTTPKNYEKIMQTILEAMNTKLLDGVIWSTSVSYLEGMPGNFTLNDGTVIDTAQIVANKHPHILLQNWVPQFATLNHTNIKLFLTHGGFQSIQESLYHAIPMLVLPLYIDQRGNAERLMLQGCALAVSKLSLSVNDMLSKMRILMTDDQIKSNLLRMQTLARMNGNRKYRAADLIEYVMDHAKLGPNSGRIPTVQEWLTPDRRMGWIKGNNVDIFVVVILVILVDLFGSIWLARRITQFVLNYRIGKGKDVKKTNGNTK
ncbi:8341_t:CDS:2 [Ambispora leptoticha]|uniref:8341_t:CDS:1 n=1 Tax=Ambispora leptoticha TaxID=144679 RepID=A0A9N9F452_9GLOM|nr:8341_t:CDS:2 [Ambispora leptoticha]